MISKNKIKQIHLLETKKGRKTQGLFVAEGPKVTGDLLSIYEAQSVYATKDWIEKNSYISKNIKEIVEVNEDELKKISMLQHPQQVLALFSIKETKPDLIDLSNKLSIALDGVQDPGNLGTIIRVADWFGITDIFCSYDTVDVYNPKVVQSTMGSIARVNVYYIDLEKIVDRFPNNFPVFGTSLDGQNIYEQELSDKGLIIMGNEGNGISQPIMKKITKKLLIPNYPHERETADSLNVAIATAIVCGEFRRKCNK